MRSLERNLEHMERSEIFVGRRRGALPRQMVDAWEVVCGAAKAASMSERRSRVNRLDARERLWRQTPAGMSVFRMGMCLPSPLTSSKFNIGRGLTRMNLQEEMKRRPYAHTQVWADRRSRDSLSGNLARQVARRHKRLRDEVGRGGCGVDVRTGNCFHNTDLMGNSKRERSLRSLTKRAQKPGTKSGYYNNGLSWFLESRNASVSSTVSGL
jgi:hypothetical protein